MIGSTIIKVDDVESLKKMSIDDIIETDQFKKIELDYLVTLDFEMLVGKANKKWSNGQPAYFSEEEGIVVLPLDVEGVNFVIDQKDLEEDEIKKGDLDKLSIFVEEVGSINLFEIATF